MKEEAADEYDKKASDLMRHIVCPGEIARQIIAQGLRQCAEEARAKTDQLIIDADSYLSLIYHRHLNRENVDTSLDLELQQVLGRLRKASNEAIRAMADTGAAQEKQETESGTVTSNVIKERLKI